MNKKGFYFSILSLLLVITLILIFGYSNAVTGLDKVPPVKTRVTVINNYVKALEETYIPSQLQLAVREGLDEMVTPTFSQYSTSTSFVTEYKNKINSQFLSKINTIKDEADSLHKTETTITLDPSSIKLTQTSPWHVDIEAKFSLIEVEDNLKTADWEINNKEIKTKVSIGGLKDPLYAAQNIAGTRAARQFLFYAKDVHVKDSTDSDGNPVNNVEGFLRTDLIPWQTVDKEDTQINLINIVTNKLYIPDKDGLCYLNRFIAKGQYLSLSDCGITSFLDVGDYVPFSPNPNPLKAQGNEQQTVTKTVTNKDFRDYKFYLEGPLPYIDTTPRDSDFEKQDIPHQLYNISKITSMCEYKTGNKVKTGLKEESGDKPCTNFQKYHFKINRELVNLLNLNAHACRFGSTQPACASRDITLI